MLAAEVRADLLVLMSDVDGIYTLPPKQVGAKMIWTYNSDMADIVQFGKKSTVGTGGMDSKVSGRSAQLEPLTAHDAYRLIARHIILN